MAGLGTAVRTRKRPFRWFEIEKNISDEMVLTKINEYYEFLFLEMDFIKIKV